MTGILLVSFFSQEGMIVRFFPISIGEKVSFQFSFQSFSGRREYSKEKAGSSPDDLRTSLNRESSSRCRRYRPSPSK
jgi:hypothetical protein